MTVNQNGAGAPEQPRRRLTIARETLRMLGGQVIHRAAGGTMYSHDGGCGGGGTYGTQCTCELTGCACPPDSLPDCVTARDSECGCASDVDPTCETITCPPGC